MAPRGQDAILRYIKHYLPKHLVVCSDETRLAHTPLQAPTRQMADLCNCNPYSDHTDLLLTAISQFIALGGIIGIGFFRGSSKSLGICGPVGALIAVFVVGIVATAVMECICELVILWPISNAMVEYVKAFVDEDLGIAVGVMHW